MARPQSGRRIRGGDQMRAFREAYPNPPPTIRRRRVLVRDGPWLAQHFEDVAAAGGRSPSSPQLYSTRWQPTPARMRRYTAFAFGPHPKDTIIVRLRLGRGGLGQWGPGRTPAGRSP